MTVCLLCQKIVGIVIYSILAVVSISFSNDDYQASESSGRISVVVVKDNPIATPITLSIIPRTVPAQRASGSPLPPNIPADSTVSPPFASKSTNSIEYARVHENSEGLSSATNPQPKIKGLPSHCMYCLIVPPCIMHLNFYYYYYDGTKFCSLDKCIPPYSTNN